MIIKIENSLNLTDNDIQQIKKCADLIKKGDIISFPTETVYGIGASIFSEQGIKKIFYVKKRPSDNPLIAHISSFDMLSNLIIFKDQIQKDIFYTFAKKLWPGPISFILNAKNNISKLVTAELPTIAVRMPDNKIALKLIEFSNSPIVAPSANLSGKPSGTTAKDVYNDFKENIPYIIDGGKTNIGIESTVVDLTDTNITILRPGYIIKEDLEKIIYNSDLQKKYKNSKERFIIKYIKHKSEIVKSPGLKYKHYKPEAKTYLINTNLFSKQNFNIKIRNIFHTIYKEKLIFIVTNKSLKKLYPFLHTYNIQNDYQIQIKDNINIENIFNIINKNNYKFILLIFKNYYHYASNLYYIFRLCDSYSIKNIFLEKPINKGFGFSLNNRLIKASNYIIE